MESSPTPLPNPLPTLSGRWGGEFYQALADLKVLSTPGGGGLSQMGGLKIFTLLGGTTGFSLLGGWEESLPHWSNIYSSLLQ